MIRNTLTILIATFFLMACGSATEPTVEPDSTTQEQTTEKDNDDDDDTGLLEPCAVFSIPLLLAQMIKDAKNEALLTGAAGSAAAGSEICVQDASGTVSCETEIVKIDGSFSMVLSGVKAEEKILVWQDLDSCIGDSSVNGVLVKILAADPDSPTFPGGDGTEKPPVKNK